MVTQCSGMNLEGEHSPDGGQMSVSSLSYLTSIFILFIFTCPWSLCDRPMVRVSCTGFVTVFFFSLHLQLWFFSHLIILLSEKVLSARPDRAMPQPKRKRQKSEKEDEKAAHVPDTAMSRLEMSRRMRRPYLGEKCDVFETLHISNK